MDNNLLSRDMCPGLTKYFYFEYQCGAKKTVHGVVHAFLIFSLSSKVDILSCKVQKN